MSTPNPNRPLPPHLADATQPPPPVPSNAAPLPTARPLAAPRPIPTQPSGPPQPPAAPSTPQAVPARPVAVPQATPALPAQPTATPVNRPRPVPVTPRPVPLDGGAVNGQNRPVPVGSKGMLVRELDPARDPEALDQPTEKVVRAAPPWLVSMVIHMVLFVILAIITFSQMGKKEILVEVTYAEELGEQLEEDQLESIQMEALEIDPVLSEDIEVAEDPFAAPPEILEINLEAITASSDVVAPSIGLALSGREKGRKKALLGEYGGTKQTEAAVAMALNWLKKNQQRDGMWSLEGPYTDGAVADNRLAATAMALLAFQGAGNTHQQGTHKQVVAKAWKALLPLQDADGNFFSDRDARPHDRFYTQAQVTIALCEIYGMTGDEKFKEPAQRAINYAAKTQSPKGGWRYYPKGDSDTSVTGWFVMAFQSAMMAGLEVQSPTLESISGYLDSASTDGGSLYAYQPGKTDTPAMTAEGLLSRQYLGWKRDDPRLGRGVEYVANNPITWRDHHVYYWYYATQVMHHMGGEHWEAWNNVMRVELPAKQLKTGGEKGSWDPQTDRHGNRGGRLYVTCFSVYMLEVYYRHLPIYKHIQ